jgi:hypothetical protein
MYAVIEKNLIWGIWNTPIVTFELKKDSFYNAFLLQQN